MSQSRDPRIDAYVAKAAPFAQPILAHLRALVHTACPDATETIKWGMPFFECAGKPLCNMAAFKAHCAFGFWHQGMRPLLEAERTAAEPAMGALGRIASAKDLPGDKTMLRLLRTAAKLNVSATPARPKTTPRKALPVPKDLAAALKKNAAAARTFAAFSPSHRREYIEWITEAKRDETRRTRLATTLEWLESGKPRHWKYRRD